MGLLGLAVVADVVVAVVDHVMYVVVGIVSLLLAKSQQTARGGSPNMLTDPGCHGRRCRRRRRGCHGRRGRGGRRGRLGAAGWPHQQ